jgi:hypothetical protein
MLWEPQITFKKGSPLRESWWNYYFPVLKIHRRLSEPYMSDTEATTFLLYSKNCKHACARARAHTHTHTHTHMLVSTQTYTNAKVCLGWKTHQEITAFSILKIRHRVSKHLGVKYMHWRWSPVTWLLHPVQVDQWDNDVTLSGLCKLSYYDAQMLWCPSYSRGLTTSCGPSLGEVESLFQGTPTTGARGPPQKTQFFLRLQCGPLCFSWP